MGPQKRVRRGSFRWRSGRSKGDPEIQGPKALVMRNSGPEWGGSCRRTHQLQDHHHQHTAGGCSSSFVPPYARGPSLMQDDVPAFQASAPLFVKPPAHRLTSSRQHVNLTCFTVVTGVSLSLPDRNARDLPAPRRGFGSNQLLLNE